jgi:hypothetical protein
LWVAARERERGMELWQLDATELARLIRVGQATPAPSVRDLNPYPGIFPAVRARGERLRGIFDHPNMRRGSRLCCGQGDAGVSENSCSLL